MLEMNKTNRMLNFAKFLNIVLYKQKFFREIKSYARESKSPVPVKKRKLQKRIKKYSNFYMKQKKISMNNSNKNFFSGKSFLIPPFPIISQLYPPYNIIVMGRLIDFGFGKIINTNTN